MEAYRNRSIVDQFAPARVQFARLVESLKGQETADLDHGQLEEFLRAKGAELMRTLLQSHLALRALREPRRSSVRATDGVVRNHVRFLGRPLETIFGRVSVKRWAYSVRGMTSLAPLDAELNLPPELYSHGLRYRVATEAARGSFDETVKAVEQSTAGHVPKRQAEQLTVRAAKDFDAFYDQRKAQSPEDSRALLVMSLDSKGVVMRTEDLRKETRKRAAKSKRKLNKRVTRGEARNRKRHATVAAVYTVEPHERTAKEVMNGLGSERTITRAPPRPHNKRVWARIAKKPEEVIEEIIAEARKRDPLNDRHWVLLVDGDERQLRWCRAAIKKHGLKVTIVLDFIHVLEYLWRAAYCLNAEASTEAEQWVTDRALAILEGKASNVAAGIRRSATRRGLVGQKRKVVDKSVNYLLKYKALMRYDAYLYAGLPIATGVIEGACRYLVKDRMEVTGARWSLVGAEAVLRLRSLKASGDFNEYWHFHTEREYAAHHATEYIEPTLRAA